MAGKSRIPYVIGAVLGLFGSGIAAASIYSKRGYAGSSAASNLAIGTVLGTTSWLTARVILGKDSGFAKGLAPGLALGYAGAFAQQAFLVSPEQKANAVLKEAGKLKPTTVGNYIAG